MASQAESDVVLDSSALLGVARFIGKDWKHLGRVLGLEDASLEEIEEMNKKYGFREMAYQTMVTWQQINGNKATVARLQRYLSRIGRKDIKVAVSSNSFPDPSSYDPTCSNWSPTSPTDSSQISTSLMVDVADLLGRDWKRLGRRMDLPEKILKDIAEDHRSEGVQEIGYQVLHTWKQRKHGEATRNALEDHLASIDRSDIVATLTNLTSPAFKGSKGSSNITFKPLQGIFDKVNAIKQKRLVLKNVRRYLKNEYKSLQMMGLPWMGELVLTLDEYYVELSMVNGDKNGGTATTVIQLPNLFDSTKKKMRPRRILIEGGPGMGKTTLAAKLAYDWSRKNSYLSDFDLVILLPLRHFDGDFFDMVCRAVDITDKDRQHIFEIINDPSRRVLFILDGYDEASTHTKENIAPLLKKEQYSGTFVIVTSRAGNLTSSKGSGTKILSAADVRPTVTQFLDKQVTIKGLNSKQQTEFVSKHMACYSRQQIAYVTDKLNQMVEKEFSKCPLFLLMLIIVFTSGESTESMTTKTDLYKHVFNSIIKRYFCKCNTLSVQSMDIFSYIGDDVPLHVKLMTDFSKISLSAMKTDTLHFSADDIIKTGNSDRRILDLGFLIQSISVKGFRKTIVYEPVHKSLLEFAAAYGLWVSFTEEPTEHWKEDIISLRPQLETACSSLFFPFLVGLMGKKSATLFDVLAPYASDYTSWFGTFGFSLLEISMTDSILTSLTPFLPAEWLIKWFPHDNGFCSSVQHEDIIRWGMQQKKIKMIRWNTQNSARLPKNVELDTVILAFNKRHIKSDEAIHVENHPNPNNNQHKLTSLLPKSIHCRNLWCLFASHIQSVQLWQTCLDAVNFFDYQHLCFDAPFLLHWFPSVYDAVICGKIPDNIYRLKSSYHLGNAEAKHSFSQVIDMIGRVKIKNLTTNIDNNCPQMHIDNLINTAAKSAHLTSFTLNSINETSLFTVDLAELFDGGAKQWNLVRLQGVQAQCHHDIKTNSAAKLVDVVLPTVNALPTSMICNLQMTSFSCHYPLLSNSLKSFPHLKSVTELNVILDKSVIAGGLVCLPTELKQLKVLVLIVTRFECSDFTHPTRDWLFGSVNQFRLKGLEVWKIEDNPLFASVLIKYIIRCLDEGSFNLVSSEEHIHDDSLYSKTLKVDYLLLRTHLTHNLENLAVSFTSTSEGAEFISTMSLLKKSLVLKILPRLDMVHVVRANHFWPFTFGSLMDIYPPTEGYRVERDLWGSTEDDSIYSQEMHASSPGMMERISVTFNKIHDKCFHA